MPRRFEGFWDCQSCGAIGNPGLQDICNGCGKPKDDNTHYYMTENARVLVNPDDIAVAAAGPDWYCSHCNSNNPATSDVCRYCGASKEDSEEHDVITYTRDVPDSHDEAVAMRQEREPLPYSPPVVIDPQKPTTRRNVLGTIGIVALIAFLIGGGWYFFFDRRDVDAHVTGFEWKLSVSIEEYRTVREEDWSIPQGGRYVDEREVKVGEKRVYIRTDPKTRTVYVDVPDGKEEYACGLIDEGNGSFSEKTCTRDKTRSVPRIETYSEDVYEYVPEYRTKYAYNIERWVYDRDAVATANDQAPVWPDLNLERNEREQVHSRRETYVILLSDQEDYVYREYLAREEWETFSIGDEVTMSVNRANDVEDLEKAA